jgi:hypothetical protein
MLGVCLNFCLPFDFAQGERIPKSLGLREVVIPARFKHAPRRRGRESKYSVLNPHPNPLPQGEGASPAFFWML